MSMYPMMVLYSNQLYAWLCVIAPQLIAIGFLLVLGGTRYGSSVRIFPGLGRGIIVPWAAAGAGIVLIVVTIILGQVM